MGCASQCAKYFLCLFNFVFFVVGGAALALGIWLFADSSSLADLIGKLGETQLLNKTNADVIRIISYILILVGALIFIVSFLGYCGALVESRCLLCIYGVLILLVLILECVVVGLAVGLKGDSEKTQSFLLSTFKYYDQKTEQGVAASAAWDGIMIQLRCCGVHDHLDFQREVHLQNKSLPEACCLKDENGELVDSRCTVMPNSSNAYYYKGCYNAMVEAVEENAVMLIGVAAGLAFIEILMIILALYLACCKWRPQHVLTCCC